MTIERFTKDEFEQVLTDAGYDWSDLGLLTNEYVYRITVTDNSAIELRSSIDASHKAADVGQDSIRMWPQIRVPYGTGHKWSAGRKPDAYTTRVPGWQDRMTEKINGLVIKCERVKNKVGYCPDCKRALWANFSNSAKNPGRPFASCKVKQHKSFTWLDQEVKAVKEVKPILVETDAGNTSSFLNKEVQAPTPDNAPQETQTVSKQVALVETVETFQLNEFQQKVVDTKGIGKLVVDSCPGSGKTRTVESLVAEILKNGDPSRIGAFTFSKKAASEMRWRIARTIWPNASQDELDFFADPLVKNNKFSKEWVESDPRREFIVNWVCTIHALSYRLLKASGQKMKVLSGKMQWEVDNILKDTIKELDWNEGLKPVKSYISLAILNLVQPPDCEKFYSAIIASLGGPTWVAPKMAECYKRYYSFLKQRNLADFDMLLARAIYSLRHSESFREKASSLFDHVIVDEAQDTSDLQMEIINSLVEKSGNLTLVGDVDQSMYAFRGARPEVLHGLDSTRLTLPINYRSTKNIIATAEKLIAYNYTDQQDLLKPFEPRPNADNGKDVEAIITENFIQMSSEVVSLIKNDDNPGDWFVLSRTRAECAAIHVALIANEIPAINAVGGLLFGAPHIRKVLAYARLACNYQDARDDLDVLGEVANVATKSFKAPLTRRRHLDNCNETRGWINCGCPIVYEEGIDYCHSRYYGKKSIEQAGNWSGILQHTYDKNKGGYPTLKAKASQDLVSFINRLEHVSDSKKVLKTIVDDCVLPWLIADQGIVVDDLAENGVHEEFDVLLSLTRPNETIEDFLKRVEELSEGAEGENHNSVMLGTFHWSKGAERPKVVVNTTRCPIVPPKQAPDALPTNSKVNINEERRLIYVGVTRAKEQAIIVNSEEWNNRPADVSRFIPEMGCNDIGH